MIHDDPEVTPETEEKKCSTLRLMSLDCTFTDDVSSSGTRIEMDADPTRMLCRMHEMDTRISALEEGVLDVCELEDMKEAYTNVQTMVNKPDSEQVTDSILRVLVQAVDTLHQNQKHSNMQWSIMASLPCIVKLLHTQQSQIRELQQQLKRNILPVVPQVKKSGPGRPKKPTQPHPQQPRPPPAPAPAPPAVSSDGIRVKRKYVRKTPAQKEEQRLKKHKKHLRQMAILQDMKKHLPPPPLPTNFQRKMKTSSSSGSSGSSSSDEGDCV